MKKYTGWLAIAALVLTSACSGQDGEDGDDATGTTDMSGTADMGEADGGGMDHDGMASDTMSGDMADEDMGGGSTVEEWAFVLIDDGDGTADWKPDCGTSGPGGDMDMAALWRDDGNGGFEILGVAKPGSVQYVWDASLTECPDKKAHDDPQAFEGPFGDVDDKANGGYHSLNGGSIVFQFGACDAAKLDLTSEQTMRKTCDGSGDVVPVRRGDQIDVYKVDQYYIDKEWLDFDSVPTESFELILRKEADLSDGELDVGNFAGTQTFDDTVTPAKEAITIPAS